MSKRCFNDANLDTEVIDEQCRPSKQVRAAEDNLELSPSAEPVGTTPSNNQPSPFDLLPRGEGADLLAPPPSSQSEESVGPSKYRRFEYRQAVQAGPRVYAGGAEAETQPEDYSNFDNDQFLALAQYENPPSNDPDNQQNINGAYAADSSGNSYQQPNNLQEYANAQGHDEAFVQQCAPLIDHAHANLQQYAAAGGRTHAHPQHYTAVGAHAPGSSQNNAAVGGHPQAHAQHQSAATGRTPHAADALYTNGYPSMRRATSHQDLRAQNARVPQQWAQANISGGFGQPQIPSGSRMRRENERSYHGFPRNNYTYGTDDEVQQEWTQLVMQAWAELEPAYWAWRRTPERRANDYAAVPATQQRLDAYERILNFENDWMDDRHRALSGPAALACKAMGQRRKYINEFKAGNKTKMERDNMLVHPSGAPNKNKGESLGTKGRQRPAVRCTDPLETEDADVASAQHEEHQTATEPDYMNQSPPSTMPARTIQPTNHQHAIQPPQEESAEQLIQRALVRYGEQYVSNVLQQYTQPSSQGRPQLPVMTNSPDVSGAAQSSRLFDMGSESDDHDSAIGDMNGHTPAPIGAGNEQGLAPIRMAPGNHTTRYPDPIENANGQTDGPYYSDGSQRPGSQRPNNERSFSDATGDGFGQNSGFN